MGKRHPNYRLVKIHRNYTISDIADLYGIHKNTVRMWIKDGLPKIDDDRPILIHGLDLSKFLKDRKDRQKQKLKPGEFYCFRCRTPRRPAGNWAEYKPNNEYAGNVSAICPICDGIMNRAVNLKKIHSDFPGIEVMF